MNEFLEPESFNLVNLFENAKYSVPVYQRPYSWSEKEIKKLLDDIFLIFDNKDNLQNEELILFMGTLFLKVGKNIGNKYTEYEIVDGQQRITTFTLILMVMLNYFYQKEIEADEIRKIENFFWKKDDSRKRDKEKRALTLGSVEQKILNELFNQLYDKKDLMKFIEDRQNNFEIDEITKNLLKNIVFINKFFKEKYSSEDSSEKYLDFFDFFETNIRFIAIKVNVNLMKLFSIFESINAKGKKLEEIDLIKNYIFQNIKEEDYKEYLEKWGNLIIETSDNLMDYIIVYVRANMSYYRNNIKLENFKKIIEEDAKNYYQTTENDETIKKFIDDLSKNSIYYKVLYEKALPKDILEKISKKILAFFEMNRIMEYSHTKALYFKLLTLYKENKISEEIFFNIVVEAFKFILTYQSIGSRESKRTIGIFVDVQNKIYNFLNKNDFQKNIEIEIKNIFYREIKKQIIDNESLSKSIIASATYHKYPKVIKILLTYLEAYGEKGLDYDKFYTLLNSIENLQLDHILPQNPKKDDNNFSYYIENEKVEFKEFQDFNEKRKDLPLLADDFYKEYLNQIGNMRLTWAKENKNKSNKVLYQNNILLREDDKKINTYKQIKKRQKELIDEILSKNILLSSDNINIQETIKDEIVLKFFEESRDYKKLEPVSLKVFDNKIALNDFSYINLLVEFYHNIYENEKDRFLRIAENNYKLTKAKRIYISTDETLIKNKRNIEETIFYETNFSSERILKIIFNLKNEMNLEDLEIILRDK